MVKVLLKKQLQLAQNEVLLKKNSRWEREKREIGEEEEGRSARRDISRALELVGSGVAEC
jgi:hypothetical protein